MPSGLHQYQKGGGLHFITFSCYHRLKNLDTPAARNLFENALETMRDVIGWRRWPTSPCPNTSIFFSVSRFAEALPRPSRPSSFPLRYASAERPFWLARYFDGDIHEERVCSEVIRYIHRNPGVPADRSSSVGWKPVARGLVRRPEDWPWSSFRHYATGERGTVEIESFWTAWKRQNETLVPVRSPTPPAAVSPGSQHRGPGAPKHRRKNG